MKKKKYCIKKNGLIPKGSINYKLLQCIGSL